MFKQPIVLKTRHNLVRMMLQKIKLLWLPAVLALQCFLGGALQAAPQLDLRVQDRARLNTDIRAVWHTTMVLDKNFAPTQPLDAQSVWDWPDSRFQPGQTRPVTIKDDERLVGRWSMLVKDSPYGLLVELPVPRLDLVHLSYRYNNEAWTQISTGDQVPMVKWPFPNRNPAFAIPPKAGELQIVLDIPIPGLFPSPVMLWGELAFLEQQAIRNIEVGTALAFALMGLLMCIGAAAIFKRFAFVAVGLYSASIFLVSGGQGGVFGMYIGTATTWFNDYIKYVSAAIFGAMVPWTISMVVTQKHYSRLTAYAASSWVVGSLVVMVVMLFTVPRATQWAMLSPYLIVSLLFGLGIALASVLRNQRHGGLALAAMVLLCAGIFAPIASYWGYLDGTFSFSVSSISFFLSNTFLLLALLLQYRHGNSVIVRAERSSGRDALTGLLNRAVFEGRLAKIVRAAGQSNSSALFLYIAISDRDTLQEQFGGEGFESGMVQMAAALSSSISVVDTVARLSSNAFGVLVVMPPEVKLGNALAQKIITRTMAVASHSAPMAQTARIALAWVPTHGRQLGRLENSAKKVLQQMGDGKRVGWVSSAAELGNSADVESAPSSASDSQTTSKPRGRAEELNSLINGLEDAMRHERFDAVEERAKKLT